MRPVVWMNSPHIVWLVYCREVWVLWSGWTLYRLSGLFIVGRYAFRCLGRLYTDFDSVCWSYCSAGQVSDAGWRYICGAGEEQRRRPGQYAGVSKNINPIRSKQDTLTQY